MAHHRRSVTPDSMPPLCSSSDSETLEPREKAGANNQPEDKGVSKGKGTYTSTETGRGERKRKEYTRFGRRAAPENSDESEDVENPDLDNKTSVLLRKGKAKGKGQKQGEGRGQSSRPAAKPALKKDSATNVSA